MIPRRTTERPALGPIGPTPGRSRVSKLQVERQAPRASSTGAKRRPRSVSLYSAWGGDAGTTRRSSTPAASSSRSRSVSVRAGTPSTACRNSLKRAAPSSEAQITEITQRRSRRSAAARTSSGTGRQLRQRTGGYAARGVAAAGGGSGGAPGHPPERLNRGGEHLL